MDCKSKKKKKEITKTFCCYTLLTHELGRTYSTYTSAYHDMNMAAVVINGTNLQLSMV